MSSSGSPPSLDSRTALTIPRGNAEIQTLVDQKTNVMVGSAGEFVLTPVPTKVSHLTVRSLTDPASVNHSMGSPCPPANATSILKSQINREIEFQTASDLKDNSWKRGVLVSIEDQGPHAVLLVSIPSSSSASASTENTIGNMVLSKETLVNVKLNSSTPPSAFFNVPYVSGSLSTRSTSQQHELAVKYTTTGISWNASYHAVLNANATEMTFFGTYTLTNSCGCDYTASLAALTEFTSAPSSYDDAPSSERFSKSSLFESSKRQKRKATISRVTETYSLNRLIDIPEGTTTIPFLEAVIPVRLYTVIHQQSQLYAANQFKYRKYPDIDRSSSDYYPMSVSSVLEFENLNNKYGETTLPQGSILSMHKWGDTTLGLENFAASRSIAHTASGGLIRLALEPCTFLEVLYKKVDNTVNKRDHIFSETMQLIVKDKRKEGADKIVRFEPLQPRWNEWVVGACFLNNTAITPTKLGNPATHCLFEFKTSPHTVQTLVYSVEYTKWITAEEAQAQRDQAQAQQEQAALSMITTRAATTTAASPATASTPSAPSSSGPPVSTSTGRKWFSFGSS
ncbi:hypothetical protein Pelo_7888 [Pelomyxa schiedti]|nr:hypothetical protein Pelo_7888 [Pelomyxa schiedti]